MIIAQLSDTHISTPASDDARGAAAAAARAQNLAAAVAAVNALRVPADAVIFTGDMVQTRTADEYALARELLCGLDAPLYVAPGNRDCRASLRREFGADGYMDTAIDGTDDNLDDRPILYAVEDHPVRLVGFDTQSGDMRKGDVDPERLEWLEMTLSRRPDVPTAIFMHHPPLDIVTSDQPWQYLRREAGDEIAAVIARQPQVIRLFCGHSHRDFQSEFAGIPAGTMPSIAVDLRLGAFPAEHADRALVFVHRFDAEHGRFESEVVCAAMSDTHNAMPPPANNRKGLDEPPAAMG